MKSSLQCTEKTLDSHRVLLRALFWSLALHTLAFGMLVPQFGGTGRQVPPDRTLHGHLRLPVPQAVEAVSPVPVSPPPAPLRQPVAPLAKLPTPSPAAAVLPEPTFSASPRAAVEAGGVPVARDPAMLTTVAVVQEVPESGPDAAGLRQYRLALAGEARRFRRYPEIARRDGLAGTAEIRVAVMQGERLAELSRSSGHALLDAAALEMLRQAAARTQLPDSLRGQKFAVLLPVVFEVEE